MGLSEMIYNPSMGLTSAISMVASYSLSFIVGKYYKKGKKRDKNTGNRPATDFSRFLNNMTVTSLFILIHLWFNS